MLDSVSTSKRNPMEPSSSSPQSPIRPGGCFVPGRCTKRARPGLPASSQAGYARWTPNPVIVTIRVDRDHNKSSNILLHHTYRVGVVLR